jgi:hypothetical protein
VVPSTRPRASCVPFQNAILRRRKYGIGRRQRDVPVRLFCFELLYGTGRGGPDRPAVPGAVLAAGQAGPGGDVRSRPWAGSGPSLSATTAASCPTPWSFQGEAATGTEWHRLDEIPDEFSAENRSIQPLFLWACRHSLLLPGRMDRGFEDRWLSSACGVAPADHQFVVAGGRIVLAGERSRSSAARTSSAVVRTVQPSVRCPPTVRPWWSPTARCRWLPSCDRVPVSATISRRETAAGRSCAFPEGIAAMPLRRGDEDRPGGTRPPRPLRPRTPQGWGAGAAADRHRGPRAPGRSRTEPRRGRCRCAPRRARCGEGR